MTDKEIPKGRNWHAVAAWFRKGGPMKHKNSPKGGNSNESRVLIDEALDEYQTDEAQKAADRLFQATSEELGEAAVTNCRKEKEKEDAPTD